MFKQLTPSTNKVSEVIILLLLQTQFSNAQENSDTCYGPGSIATTTITTIILTIFVQCIIYAAWKRYWKNRQGNHLILQTDPEKGPTNYSYDNEGFKNEHLQVELEPNAKQKANYWSPFDGLILKNEKQKTTDDSGLQTNEIKTVLLKSRDFTGLGFNIYGNMRDGIFIKDILQRGPAYECGKLNLGDRLKNVTINFDHIVYEDALAILSYASPYEVIIQAQSEKNNLDCTNNSKSTQIGHPLYLKSTSVTDLLQIRKNDKLFIADSPKTPARTPKASPHNSANKSKSPTSTKIKLQQALLKNQNQQQKIKEKPVTHENEPKSLENKYQKIGIRVLPVDLKINRSPEPSSPKSAELSQNDNNINLERHLDNTEIELVDDSIDEVDIITPNNSFINRSDINGSGIKRNKDGIPQEIPSFMLNAAVAARKNRKNHSPNNSSLIKSPKKPKGKAPAPPEEKHKSESDLRSETETNSLDVNWEGSEPKSLDYISDSDVEIESNQSSKIIELNSVDVTIHQFEEDEVQNRKTASTGDLTKIQNASKSNTSSLERAQSLDITDSVIMPVLSKKHTGVITDNGDFDLHKKVIELDGLNGFPTNRLVKSSEWGNLEDAMLDFAKDDDFKNSSDLSTSDLNGQDDIDDLSERNKLSISTIHINSSEPNFIEQEPVTFRVVSKNYNKNFNESNGSTGDSLDIDSESLSLEKYCEQIAKEIVLKDLQTWLIKEREGCSGDPFYDASHINVSDDVKVHRHSLNSLEKKTGLKNVTNVSIENEDDVTVEGAIESPQKIEKNDKLFNSSVETVFIKEPNCNKKNSFVYEKTFVELPELITKAKESNQNTHEHPLVENNVNRISIDSSKDSKPTYVTEIQLLPSETEEKIQNITSKTINETQDPAKELHKIQEIVKEQLKKLPEMRYSTSSYESPVVLENNGTQINILKTNFENKNTSRSHCSRSESNASLKSRIPVAMSKTPPTSPERRLSQNLDLGLNSEIVQFMSSPMPSTTVTHYTKSPNKNGAGTKYRF